jgi:hypothetical protein
MKYIYLLLSSLVLVSCSGSKFDNQYKVAVKNGKDGKASFNDLSYDMIRLIATFVEPEDIFNWRYVNCLTLYSLPLKKSVEQTFNIFGLESVADNEPELAGVMRFARISHDPLLLFKALMEDVVEEKKPYKVLFSPLISHLFRAVTSLQENQQYFKRNFNNVESYIIKHCFMKNHFDLVLEIVRGNAHLSGKALQCAAQLGDSNLVKFLESSADTSADHAGFSLEYAVKYGHFHIAELLIQSRTDISASHAGYTLEHAAKYGVFQIVELLFQSRTDISADHVGYALRNAAENGHFHIVELFLQSRTDIPENHAGFALDYAAERGHALIVEILLQSRTDISAYFVGLALKDAAEGGHTDIVDFLLQSRTDIPDYYVEKALENDSSSDSSDDHEEGDSEDGDDGYHIDSLERHTNSAADQVGWGLKKAALGEHNEIVDLLLQRSLDIDVHHIGAVFQRASRRGHKYIVEFLLQRRPDIPDHQVGWAIREATLGRHTEIVNLLLQYRNNITACYIGLAHVDEAEIGSAASVELLHLRNDISADYADMDSEDDATTIPNR